MIKHWAILIAATILAETVMVCGIATSTHAASIGTVERIFNFHAFDLISDPSRHYVYATTGTSLELINTNTLTVEKSLPLTNGGARMGLSADAKLLYVAGGYSNSVYVVDLDLQSIQGTLNVGSAVFGVVAGLDNRIFVQTYTGSWTSSAIKQIDATTGASRGPNILGSGSALGSGSVYSGEMQISPDKKTLYYGNFGLSSGTVHKIDVSTTTPTVLITRHGSNAVGDNGQQLVLSHDGSMLAYVCGASSVGYAIPNLSAADLSTQGGFNTGAFPNAMAYSPDDHRAYALRSLYPTAIQIYDTSTYALIGQFPAMDRGSNMIVDQSGQHLFVSYDDVYYDVSNLVAYAVPAPSGGVLALIGLASLQLMIRPKR
jgi:hypothetical protein